MDYYVLERKGNNNNPLVRFKGLSRPFHLPEPMQVTEPVELVLNSPVPRKPEMIDYHSMGGFHLVSEKVKTVLETVKTKGVQLVPGVVDVKGVPHNYWVIHAYTIIDCLDLDNSIYKRAKIGWIIDLTKIVLDTERLSKIEEHERLIFTVKEYTGVILFHKIIRDTIMSIDPKGFRFIHVDEWSDGVAFGA